MRRNHGFQFLLLQVVILLCVPAIGTAQDLKHSAFARDAFTAGINGAIGGITAGTSQLLAGKSFWRGFARGAGAGLVVFGEFPNRLAVWGILLIIGSGLVIVMLDRRRKPVPSA